MHKGRRNELTFLKYKKRIRRFAATADIYVDREGNYIYSPKTVDVLRDKGQLGYKTTSVPCSCWMCSGEYKYKRHLQKLENRKLINEFFEDFDWDT